MGDVSNETSMEDILSSIKRIIAEEGEGSAQALRGRKSIRTAQVRDLDDRDEVLELNQSVAAPPPPPRVEAMRAEPPRAERVRAPEPQSEPEPVAAAAAPKAAPSIVSDRAAEASRGALDQLSRMLVKPETPGADSLEGLVREMLRPMLREWLDAQLPGIVESMVAREIARISGRE